MPKPVACRHTSELLAVATDRRFTAAEVANFYFYALSCPNTDWPAVNRAILTRYKPSGLVRIKKMAWDQAGRGIPVTNRPEKTCA
jgi:hypothetical protein